MSVRLLVRAVGWLCLLCALPASASAADYVQAPMAAQPLMIKGNIDSGSCSTAVRLQWPIVTNEDSAGDYVLHYWLGSTEHQIHTTPAGFQDEPFGNEEYTWPGAESGHHARYFGFGTAPAEGGPPRWEACEESIGNWEAGLTGSPYAEVPVKGDPGAVSGWVTNRAGEGQGGVAVSIAGGSDTRRATTDADGHYSAEVNFVGSYTVTAEPGDGRYLSRAGDSCPAGGTSCTVEVTAGGSPVANFETALAVDSVAFEQRGPDGGALAPVPTTGTYDGNAVEVVATISNAGPQPLTTGVGFGRAASTNAAGTTPLAAAGAAPGVVTVPAGGTAKVSFAWDTQGQAWTDASRADADHIIRATTALTPSRGQATIVVRPKPLILVHGWNATHTTWATYPRLIAATNPAWQGFAVGDGQAPGVMDTTPFRFGDSGIGNTVFENAHEMDRYIEGVRADTGAWHVDIVAHSMGGLISRQYVDSMMPAAPPDGRTTVSHLVMLGTPNEGSVCADLLAAAEGGRVTIPTQQLTTTFAEAFNRTVTSRRGVPFSILAGNIHEPTCGKGADGDLVVPVPSALWKIQDHTVVPGLLHTEMGASKLAFDDWVLPHVAIGPNGGSLSGVLGRASSSAAASASTLARSGGKHGTHHSKGSGKRKKCVAASGGIPDLAATGSFVASAKGATRGLPVGAAKRIVLSVFAPEVSLRLRAPSGKAIAPVGGASNARGGLFQTFVVAHPEPGRWQLRGRGMGGGARQPVAYALRAQGTAVRLSAKLRVAHGALRTVTARFTKHGRGLSRARVRAVIKLPDGKTRKLRLRAVPGHSGSYRSRVGLRLRGDAPLEAFVHASRGDLARTAAVSRAAACRS